MVKIERWISPERGMEENDLTDTEESTVSLEDTLESLKRNAAAVETYFKEARTQMKTIHTTALEILASSAEVPLQPRTRLMKWLTDHNLPVETSFHDFFEAFLVEHKQDQRLDLSTRSIRLNRAGAHLFQCHVNTTVSLYDLLRSLSLLYV